jgi:hypothetical protein
VEAATVPRSTILALSVSEHGGSVITTAPVPNRNGESQAPALSAVGLGKRFGDLSDSSDPQDRIDSALRSVNLVNRARDACGTLSKVRAEWRESLGGWSQGYRVR